MAGGFAVRLRSARFARRLLAVSAAVWLVVFGVLGARHEARVTHVRDSQTGALVHAGPSVCHDQNPQSHVHGVQTGADHDACELLQVLHQSAAPAVAWAGIGVAAHASSAHPQCASTLYVCAYAIYRVAPKTSPPAHV